MKILIITDGYPNKNYQYVFLEQLVLSLLSLGHNITVVVPQSVTKLIFRRVAPFPRHETRRDDKGNDYELYSPRYLSFGSKFSFLRFIGYISHRCSTYNILKSKDLIFDIIYAQFLKESSFTARYISHKTGIPFIVSLGEGSRFNFDKLGVALKSTMIETIQNSSKLICLNGQIFDDFLSSNEHINQEKLTIIPNGVDSRLFYKVKKTNLRKKFNIHQDDFIVCFIGSFDHRKGILRLDEALKILNLDIKVIYIGEGDLEPNYKSILFKGSLKHTEINNYLNLADVFVLPTTGEGSCNAILEAMAVGLPIISSRDKFNDEILSDDYSFRIDSRSIHEISQAIMSLYLNPTLRQEMGDTAFKAASQFTLEKRTHKISKIINEIGIER